VQRGETSREGLRIGETGVVAEEVETAGLVGGDELFDEAAGSVLRVGRGE
jgi:hypothetical protein